MKASAIAHPIQGLVKYHGLKDPVRRIPFHDSISVCTGPIHSHTTVEVLEDGDCSAVVDGEKAAGRALERIATVMDAVREGAQDDRAWRVESKNDFPQFVGLGSSSSGFAALAVAGAAAYGWSPGPDRLSQAARLGAGSAARALTGCVSQWFVDGARSWSECLAGPEAFPDWRIVVPLIPHPVFTEDVHAEVASSPLFEARVQYIPDVVTAARKAAAEGDVETLGRIAERDTLNLHAVTMTGEAGLVTWRPATVAVMHAVRRLRDDGVPAWFSIDTGATPYINTTTDHEETVVGAVEDIEGVEDVLRLQPAGPARVVDDHLF